MKKWGGNQMRQTAFRENEMRHEDVSWSVCLMQNPRIGVAEKQSEYDRGGAES